MSYVGMGFLEHHSGRVHMLFFLFSDFWYPH